MICLDFDGVIIQSEGIKDRAFRSLFSRYKAKFDSIMDYHMKNYTTDRYSKFEYIYRNILMENYDQSVRETLGKVFNDLTMGDILKCPFVKGAEEFLEKYGQTVPLILISATPREELTHILKMRNLDGFFREVYGAPLVKWEILKEIIVRGDYNGTEVLYIGDRLEDFEAAKKARMLFLGINNDELFKKHDIPCITDFSIFDLKGGCG